MMPFWKDPYAWLLAWLKNLLASWGATDAGVHFWMSLLGALILGVLPLLITIWLIWAERKLLGRVQDRIGPNRVGPFGFFQTIADMGKIFTKEFIVFMILIVKLMVALYFIIFLSYFTIE